VKEIKLARPRYSATRDKAALVDDEDFEYLSQWQWFYHKPTGAKTGFAVRYESSGGSHRKIFMHRAIAQRCKRIVRGKVEHMDGNGLNNRRDNLKTDALSKEDRIEQEEIRLLEDLYDEMCRRLKVAVRALRARAVAQKRLIMAKKRLVQIQRQLPESLRQLPEAQAKADEAQRALEEAEAYRTAMEEERQLCETTYAQLHQLWLDGRRYPAERVPLARPKWLNET
jgi:hypothetical protein